MVFINRNLTSNIGEEIGRCKGYETYYFRTQFVVFVYIDVINANTPILYCCKKGGHSLLTAD